MNDEKECLKIFNNITKKGENEGYCDWEKYVIKEIKNYNEEKLLNLEKRTEIKYEKIAGDRYAVGPIMQQILSVAVLLMTFVVTSVLAIMGTFVATYNFEMDQEVALKFSTLVGNTLFSFGYESVLLAYILSGILLLLWIVSVFYDAWKRKMTKDKKVYYEELLKVIAKEKERRAKEDVEKKD